MNYEEDTPVETHTAHFSVNGIIDNDNDCTVAEGAAITFPDDPDDINGMTFVGWYGSTYSNQSVAPEYVTSATMGNSDVTFYAVFADADGSGDDTYEKLSSDSFDTNAQYVIGATQASNNNTMWYFYSYTNTDTNIDWGVMTSDPENNTPIRFTLSGSASVLVAKDESNNYLAGLTTGKFKMSTTSTSIALTNSGTIKNSNNGSYYLRHNYNSGNGGLRWYSSNTGTYAYFYKVIPGVSYSNYCTTVPALTHTITYLVNNGSIAGVDAGSNPVASGASIAEGATVTLTATPSDGYSFTSWEVSGTGSTLSSNTDNTTTFTMGTANATVTAHFTAVDPVTSVSPESLTGFTYSHGVTPTQTQSFTINGSNLTNDITVSLSNSYFVMSESENSGYSTNGITVSKGSGTVSNKVIYVRQATGLGINNYSSSITVASTGVSQDKTVSLSGSVTGYTLTYDGNGSDGGTVPAAVTNCTYNQEITVSGAGTMTKTGHSFSHWNTAADGSGIQYDPNDEIDLNSDVTLYAIWAKNKYNVAVSSIDNVTLSATYGTNSSIVASGNADNIDYDTEITLSATGLATGQVFIWDVYKNDDTSTKVPVTNNKFNVPDFNVTISGKIVYTGTGTILFGNGNGHHPIYAENLSGNDDLGNTWSITPVFKKNPSYTQQETYSQIGSKDNRATSLTFTTTLDVTGTCKITGFSASFGAFSGDTGDITLKVGETIVGLGSLSGTTDVTVTNESEVVGKDLTIIVTDDNLRIKCYSISYTYVLTGNTPIINSVSTLTLSSTDTENEFAYEIVNPIIGKTLSATSSTSWISDINVSSNKVTFSTSENTSTTDNRSGTITLSYDDADDKIVTINQSKVDYISLDTPYTYTGNASGTITGFTTNGLGTYSDDTPIKFDGTGDYLIIKFKEAPVSISYDLKVNGTYGANSVFDVYSSNDKETWTSARSHTTMTGTKTTYTCLDLAGKYVKWVYTTKGSGNVGLGNLKANTSYEVYGTATTTSLFPTAEKKCTIYNGGFLSGPITNSTAANLVIEDGGQLYTESANVNATVHKTIAAWNTGSTDGWYFIASPINVNNLAPTNVTNMISDETAANGDRTYDLYLLDNITWHNYRANTFNLANGQGYLYASKGGADLQFSGAIKAYDANYTISVSQGWNLIGNPYTFEAYPNQAYYTINDANSGITAQTSTSSAVVAPCTGIIVKAAEDGTVKFFKDAPETSANNGNLQMVLAHKVATRDGASVNKNIDNAIVSFNEGSQLEKFYFGNPSASIFIPQNGEDYAIAFSDRQGDVPLYFKANETGTYTISFAGDEMSLNGIYLIDILAEEEIDLSVNPSYTFIGSPADRMARFKIVFRNANGDGTSDIFAYQNGNDIIVSGEGELQIFDVMGRMVSRQRVNGVETVNAMPDGVYIFKLNGMTQKIVVR